MKLIILCLCAVLAIGSGQRITTIQLDGVQYFVSRMNPYSPELNYFLAYQYCRSLGLQLASFETKEKSESMTQYLQNAGYNKYDFWTSGNRLGTGMFLWMSTGLPFNATFDFFENSNDAVAASLIDPLDHNSNTSPQRTARDSSNGLEKGCVMLKTPSLRWAPDDCSAVKDFICEQTRCYYYNYGSIPVSSAQGRPITQTKPTETISTTTSVITTTTTTAASVPIITSTPLPLLLSSSTLAPYQVYTTLIKEDEESDEEKDTVSTILPDEHQHDDSNETENDQTLYDDNDTEHEHETIDDDNEKHSIKQNDDEDIQPTVEQRLKQITEEIEKYSSSSENNDNNAAEIGRQSFFSLSDLIKTLRPNDKKVPQIDSDYSNTMRVLGEHTSMVNNNNNDNVNSGDNKKTIDLKLTNRSIKI